MPYDPRALEARLRTLLAADEVSRFEDMEIRGARRGTTLTAALGLLGVDGTGLMLLDEHEVLRVVGVSDYASEVLEFAQERINEGPGVDCVRTGRPVAVADLAAGQTYPELWRFVLSTGEAGRVVVFRAVMSVPVVTGEQVVGTLNVMSAGARQWTYAAVIAALLRLGLAVQERFTYPPYDEPYDEDERDA